MASDEYAQRNLLEAPVPFAPDAAFDESIRALQPKNERAVVLFAPRSEAAMAQTR
jgi:hypothetical protein